MLAGNVKGKTLDKVVAQEASGRTVSVKVEDDFNHEPLENAIVRFINQNNSSIAYVDTTDSTGIVQWDDFYTDVESDDTNVPLEYKLKQNYPNPFNPSTMIPFSLERYSDVNLSIYNIKGQLVKTLVDDGLPAGEHEYRWDGDNDNSQGVAAGQYIALLRYDNGGQQTIKMLLMDGGKEC